MAKSNGRAMTWRKHDETLGGHLQKVLDALQRLPGIAERNDHYLRVFAERQRALLDALAATPAQGDPARLTV
jgi:hypothetical protein